MKTLEQPKTTEQATRGAVGSGDLLDPIHIISLGAGVQSSTMALMAAHGEIAPMPKAAIFADTQAEPASVYRWLDWLEKQLPFPVHRVTAGSLEAHVKRVCHSKKTPGNIYLGGSIPAFLKHPDGSKGMWGRNCTTDFKLRPLLRLAKRLSGVPRMPTRIYCISWVGISADESHRMKDSREVWLAKRHPLVDAGITRKMCLRWMESRGYPEPPRSSCRGCPFHSDDEWNRLKTNEPDEFEAAARWEDEIHEAASTQNVLKGIPYLHASMVKLREVDFSARRPGYEQLDMFGNECDGMCGV